MMTKQKMAYLFLVTALAVLSPALGSQLATVSQSFQVAPGGQLVVQVSSGDLEITTGAGNVQIDVVGMSQSELPDLDIHQTGSTVYVTYKSRNRHGGNIRFELNIPSDFNLDLSTAGGDISVNGNLNGTITGHTSGGDISFNDVDGQVDVKTSGGDIKGGEVRGNVDLTTSGGDIKLASANGEVSVRTSGGASVWKPRRRAVISTWATSADRPKSRRPAVISRSARSTVRPIWLRPVATSSSRALTVRWKPKRRGETSS